ncbi:MAG: type III-B CRISPR module-associated protein Cmr3 [Candidatus Desantisbacteria bacterium]
MSDIKTIRLTALDTLFFKEARPFETIGGSELTSVFPPPPRTVIGAIRSAIGETLGADWKAFNTEPDTYTIPNGRKLKDIIGYGDNNLGQLSINGIWLSKNSERLYPAPAFILRKMKDGAMDGFDSLQIGDAKVTGLGKVRLSEMPKLPKNSKMSYISAENIWLTSEGMEKILKGDYLLSKDEIFEKKDLFEEEPRLGIARDNFKRIVKDGMLYQTNHIRPKTGVSIEVDITGLDDLSLNQGVIRIGGEGRMAGLEIVTTPKFPDKPDSKDKGLILVLLTPARFDGNNWFPAGFVEEKEQDGRTVHKGKVNEISLTIHSAVIGKVLREGGWDVATRKPRPVQSLMPAGSALYCTVDEDINDAITALHNKQIGEDIKLGRGHIACALWEDSIKEDKYDTI